MPKKFVAENHRAVAAKTRQEAAKESQEKRKQKEIEEALWKEDDKNVLRKQQRKEILLKKKQIILERKAESKQLLQEELESLKPPKTILKVTRAQIQTHNNPVVAKPSPPKPKLEENLNRKKIDGEEARNVADAIAILNVKEGEDVDKHPEKRRKSAYVIFEERRLSELKTSNPHLKLSQYKKIIFKEWQKSPENPINKFGSVFNDINKM